MRNITLAVTGASGMPIALKLLQELNKQNLRINLVFSNAGLLTFHQEMNIKLSTNPEKLKQNLVDNYQLFNPNDIYVYNNNDWFAPMASGSSVSDTMIICPCSMATLAKIANGIGDDLIARSADVVIKERKNLILVPRETPLSAIHLENMLKLSRIGTSIIPPVPAFYTHPQSIDDIINFIVARILDQCKLVNNISPRWAQ